MTIRPSFRWTLTCALLLTLAAGTAALAAGTETKASAEAELARLAAPAAAACPAPSPLPEASGLPVEATDAAAPSLPWLPAPSAASCLPDGAQCYRDFQCCSGYCRCTHPCRTRRDLACG